MREILFRGKSANTRKWIIGDYEHFYLSDGELVVYISEWGERNDKVFPETVGQYTGLTDKNGKRIFEGDIVRVDDTENAVVEYDETSAFYMVVFDRAESDFGSLIEQYPNVEVIGNIHDNPELLKGADR